VVLISVVQVEQEVLAPLVVRAELRLSQAQQLYGIFQVKQVVLVLSPLVIQILLMVVWAVPPQLIHYLL
jgi:hypothetical protein